MTQNTNKSTVAIIGIGHIGKAVAENLVKGGREVIVADRSLDKAKAFALKLGDLATAADITSAIKKADIIVFAVWFNVIGELMKEHAAALQGKIIVDPSNPIAPDEKGGFKKIIGEKESAGSTLASLLPVNAKFVKAFGTLGAASLINAAFQQPRNVLFYATGDSTVNKEVEALISDSGFDPVRVGDIDQSIRIEVFGDLHEYGALGRTISAVEAAEKI